MKIYLPTESDTVTIGGATVPGPAVLTVDSVTVSGTLYDRGVVMVKGGTATRLAEFTEVGQWSLIWAVIFAMVLGVASARLFAFRGLLSFLFVFFVCSGDLSAATLHRVQQTVNNPNNDSRTYRVTVFNADITLGTTVYNWTPTVSRSGENSLTHYTQYKVFVNGTETHTSAMLVNPNGAGASWSGVSAWTGPLYSQSTPFSSRSVQKRIWSMALGGAWGSYNSLSSGEIGSVVEESSGATWERGDIVNQWEFQLAAHSSINLNIEQSDEFFLVIDELTQVGTPDGGSSFTYEEIEEYTSTEFTSASDTPSSTTTVGPPDYDSGETASPTARPHATADTTAKLDANQEARSTDEKKILEQIREGIDTGVNSSLATGSQAHSDAQGIAQKLDDIANGEGEIEEGTAGGIEEAKGDIISKGAQVYDSLGDMSDAVDAFSEQLMLSIPSTRTYPTIVIDVPPVLGGGEAVLALAEYADWIDLIRAAMLLVVVFTFGIAMLETAKSAFV